MSSAPSSERAPRGAPAWVLSAGGVGFVPFAPGTAASLVTALAILGAQSFAGRGLEVAGLLLLLGCAATLWFAGRAIGPDGRGDPGWVVTDEVAGQAVASAAALPWGPWAAGLAFAGFRILDVLKPVPIRPLERLPGATGVLLDDLAAGLGAASIVWAAGLLGLLG